MGAPTQKGETLHKSAVYASQSTDLQVSSVSHGSLVASPETQQNAILEPSGTAVVFTTRGSLQHPSAAFSLESCSIDPLSERFLPDIAWNLDGKLLCGLTTHGQLFILTESGQVSRHYPGPLIDPSQFSGKLPIAFTPIPDNRLLVLTTDASTFSIDLNTGRCSADRRFRRGFNLGRALTYHAPSQTLLLVADGRTAPGTPGGHCADTRTPSIAAWTLKPRSAPRLLASVRGARADSGARREFWRTQLSPDGRLVTLSEPHSGWSVMAGPDAKFQALQVQREDAGPEVRVASVAWEDETHALVAWSDGGVHRLEFEAMRSLYVPMRSVGAAVKEGSCLAHGYGGMDAGTQRGGMSTLVVLEPAWEDGAAVSHGQHYTGTAEEMATRKGVPIPNKFGIARRIIGWRLSELQATSPQELIEQMLPVGSHSGADTINRALAAARSSGLSPATVWQRVWVASAQHVADVDRAADGVAGEPEGTEWLLQQARALAGATAAAAVRLLERALALQPTLPLQDALAAGGDAVPAAVAPAAVVRMELLYCLDMARTYGAVHGANADVAGLREFVAAGPAAAAAGFAAAAKSGALETVLTRHAHAVGSEGALAALGALPDALEPAAYVRLLERLQAARPAVEDRNADLVESPEAVLMLRGELWGRQEVTERFRVAEAEVDGGDGGGVVSAEAADAWVSQRMLSIDDCTGMLSVAAALAKAWYARGPGAPARELVGVHIMQTLFRNIHVLDAAAAEDVAALSLREFLEMTEMAQTRYVLRTCFPQPPSDFPRGAELISRVAAPALSALPAREQTLANVLQLEFPPEPQWAVAVVRCDLHADCVLFGGLASLASAVLRLSKSFIPNKTPAAGNQWASLLLLLDAVAADVRSPNVPLDAEQREAFRVRIEEAGDLVRAARVFSRHGMHLMACVLTASDRASVSGLLRGLLMNATAAVTVDGGDAVPVFGRLWNDMRDLHAYVFEGQGLSLAYMLREFLRAALLAQQWEVAERHLEGNAHVQLSPYGVARTLSAAAREMFAAAQELSPSDPALAACVRCLSLRAEQNAELQRSLDLVQALRIAASDLAVPVDARTWAPCVFTLPEIFSLTGPGTASTTSIVSPPGSPTHAQTEAGRAVLAEMMRGLVEAAVAAVASNPLPYYSSLNEMIQLLYGSGGEGSTVADQQSAWLQVAWMMAGVAGGQDDATEVTLRLMREGCAEVWPVALHLCEQPRGGESCAEENREMSAFALQHCDAASMSKCLAAATAANAAVAAGSQEDAADEDGVGGEMPGGAVVEARVLKGGGLEELEAAARGGDAVSAAAALKNRALACLEPATAAAGVAAPPPRAAAQAAVACLFELLMQEGPDSLQAFTEEAGALERPERALTAAAAAAALYVLRCADGPLQLGIMQLPQAPLVAAARSAAATPQAGAAAAPDSLAAATALLDTLVAASETAAKGTELEKLVELLSGRAGLEMGAEEIVRECCRRFAELEFGTACSIAEYFTAGGPCPVAGAMADGCEALELHPAAMHAILHAHDDIATAPQQALPPSVTAARALLRTWHAVQPLLGKHAGAGWLLGELDVDGAAALEAAEVIIAADQEGGVEGAAQAAAAHALVAGVRLPELSRHLPGVLAALGVDESEWGSVTDGAIVSAVEARMSAVAAELDEEARGAGAEAGAAMLGLHGVVAALDGGDAAAVPCCAAAQRAVIESLLDTQRQLPAAALSATVMREVMALQAELARPQRWGGQPDSRELLCARARAALGVAWPETEPLSQADVASVEAAEAALLSLLRDAQADSQILAVFEVWRDVFEFGAALSAGAGRGAVVNGLVSSLCACDRIADAANVLRLCPAGAGDVVGAEAVLQQVVEEARPWSAATIALASGHPRLRAWALQLLKQGPAVSVLGAGELSSAHVLGPLLWGLAEAGGAKAAAVWQRDEVGKMIFDALRVLPVLGMQAGTEALGLPALAARLAADGGMAGIVIAGEAAAVFVGLHAGLRTPDGLLANLGRYLAASEARLALVDAQEGQAGGEYVPGALVHCGRAFGLRDWLRDAQAAVDATKRDSL
eukprot:jgi/Ulvmu1/8341/UM042_0047.1